MVLVVDKMVWARVCARALVGGAEDGMNLVVSRKQETRIIRSKAGPAEDVSGRSDRRLTGVGAGSLGPPNDIKPVGELA